MEAIYKFKDKQLLQLATIHPSAQNAVNFSSTTGINKFEQLEFLGDRILGLAVAELLYETCHEIKEIASKHAKLVSSECVAQIACDWQLDRLLQHEITLLSKKVLADATEAMLGAIYLDSSYKIVAKIIQTHWKKFLRMNSREPKMVLQEWAQSKNFGVPVYETIGAVGKDHDKVYTMQVIVANKWKAIGEGSSKQEASKQAARNLLDKLQLEQ